MDRENKKILLTGHTGFLGRVVLSAFRAKEFPCMTLSRSDQSDIVCDLAKDTPKIDGFYSAVVHCAGLAHRYPRNLEEERAFFESHVDGTRHLLNALSEKGCGKFIFISSVAVYGRDEGWLLNEEETLNPTMVYGKCKLAAEKEVIRWGQENNIPTYIFRLPLVVGDRPPGNLGAMVRAMSRGYYFKIGQINPKKSMVLATDFADFLTRFEEFDVPGIYNITDGYHPSLREIERCIARKYKLPTKPPGLPFFLIRMLGKIGDFFPTAPINTFKIKKLTTDLTYDDQNARFNLNWNPRRVIDAW